MSFPKKGKFFPEKNGYGNDTGNDFDSCYASAITAALHRSLGLTRVSVKTAVAWTGANEKTVKNWFAGRYGPSGAHLVSLARHSDDVLETLLIMAGREYLLVGAKVIAAEQAVIEILDAIRRLTRR